MDYLPKDLVDLKQVRNDLECKKSEFELQSIAKLIGITPKGLYYKLTGHRAWRENELQTVAAYIGKNYRDYLISAA